jgi:hypothetical protein
MTKKIDPKQVPVMKNYCKTCPFKPDKHGRMKDTKLAAVVQQRTLFKAHQICHGTEGKRRKANNRCKGAYDANMQIYERLGFKDLIE